MEKDVLPYYKKQTLLRAQAWIGMSLNYLPPSSKNTRETLPPSKWELASNEFMTGRTGLPASIQKTLKGLSVCMWLEIKITKRSTGSQTWHLFHKHNLEDSLLAAVTQL